MPIYQPEGIAKRMWADDQEALVSAVGSMLALNTFYSESGMVKEAASAVFSRAELNELKPPKGFFMVHQIGIGAHERYGWNRNGDTFYKSALVKYHPTFVTKAKMYREHRNQNPKLAVGIVKAAKYNYDMDRTEQVLWGEIKKCPDIYEMAKQGKETSYSMACTVPSDRCNICNNKAKTTAKYCDDLKKNMGGYDSRSKKYAFAINDDPEFNDMSEVSRPADRTAWSLGYGFHSGDDMMKAASTGYRQAPDSGLMLPIPSQRLDTPWKALLTKLASYERRCREALITGSFDGEEWQQQLWKHADFRGMTTVLEPEELDKLAALRPGTLFQQLAKRACILDLPELVALFEGSSLQKTACACGVSGAKPLLPHVFEMLSDVAGQDSPIPFLPNFAPAGWNPSCDPAYDDQIDNLMELAEKRFSYAKPSPPSQSTITIIIKRASVAQDQPDEQSADLALLYGIYKLAAAKSILEARPDINEEAFCFVLAAQNLQSMRSQ